MSWTWKVEKGDIIRNYVNTRYDIVTGGDKLRQDIRMVLSTDIRTDGIGASLTKAVGQTETNPDPITAHVPVMIEFQELVQNALTRYKTLQRRLQVNRRLSSELLQDFSPVYIRTMDNDPRKFKWHVDLFTVRGFADFSVAGTSR